MAVLRAAFERVVEGCGPELVVVLGESGLGKTRLVQEFYRSLAVATRSDAGAGYWPSGFGDRDGDLFVNPPLGAVDAAQEMPFMWWGLRVFDPERRNQGLTSAVATFKGSLEPHVAAMERAGRVRKYYLDMGVAALKLALSPVPFLSSVVSVASGGESVWSILKAGRELHKDRRLALDEAEVRIRDDLNERVVNVLGRLLRSTRDRAGVPTIVLIDNAQFSPADVGLVALLERLLREAWLGSWPLLLLVTYWEREWHEHWVDRSTRSVARLVRDLHVSRVPGWAPFELGVMAPEALRPVLAEALPGLTDVQATALLERAGGQPLFLEEIIRAARQRSRHFQDRDPAKALTDAGLDAILGIGTRVVDFTHERLVSAPDGVRELVCLSSLQGTRLLQRINRRLAERMAGVLREADCVADDGTFAAAERPYAFLQREGPTIAEFAQRLFFDVARDSAADVFDVDDALTHLRDVMDEGFREGASAWGEAEWLPLVRVAAIVLEESPEPDQRTTAAQALATLAQHASEEDEPMRAAGFATRLVEGARADTWNLEGIPFELLHAVTTALDVAGEYDAALMAARVLNDVAGSEFESATALEALGDILDVNGELHAAGDAWRAALAIRRALAQDDPSDLNERKLASAADRMARWEREQGNLDAAKRLFEEASVIVEGLHQRLGTPESERDVSVSLDRIGRVLQERGELRLALEHHERCLEISQRLMTGLGRSDQERRVSASLRRIGDVLQDLGRLDSALEQLERSLEITERLHERLETPGSELEIVFSLVQIGDVLFAQGVLPGALERYERALDMAERLFKRLGTPESERVVSTCLSSVGNVFHALGDLPGALERLEQALEVNQRVHERLATPVSAWTMAGTLQLIGGILRDQGKLPVACERYEHALRLKERVRGKLATPGSARTIATTIRSIGELLHAQGDLPAALDRYERALEVEEQVHEQLSSPNSAGSIATTLRGIGDILRDQGHLPGALERYERALEIQQRIHDQLNTPDREREVVVTLTMIAHVLRAQGDARGALQRLRPALSSAQRVYEQLGTRTSELGVSIVLDSIARCLQGQGDLVGAVEVCRRALAITERVHDQLNTPESGAAVGSCLRQMGSLLEAQGDLSGARMFTDRALKSLEDAHRSLHTPAVELEIADCHKTLGSILKSQGELDGARRRFERALEISEQHFRRIDSTANAHAVGTALRRLSEVLRRQGDLTGAQQYGERALRICESVRYRLATPASELDVSIALTDLGRIHLLREDLPLAMQRYEHARQIAERADETIDLPVSKVVACHCLEGVGHVFLMQGDARSAARMYEAGRARARAAEDGQLELRLTRMLGEALVAASDGDRATEVFEDALEVALKLADTQEVLAVRERLAAQYRRLDRREELIAQLLELAVAGIHEPDSSDAPAQLREASRLARIQGLQESEARAEVNLARITGRQGNHAEAWTHAMRAKEAANASSQTEIESAADVMLALVHVARNEHAQAIARCDEVLERMHLNPEAPSAILARLVRGRQRTRQGALEAGLHDLRSGFQLASERGDAEPTAFALLLLAENRASYGDAVDAIAPLAVAAHLNAQMRPASPIEVVSTLAYIRDKLGEARFHVTLRALRDTGDASLSRVAGRDMRVFAHLPDSITHHLRALLESGEQQADDCNNTTTSAVTDLEQ